MSEANIEVVRRWLSWSREPDPERLVDELWDKECAYYPVRVFPDARPCHGREELREFIRSFTEAWERWEVDVGEVVAVGDDRALSHVHVRGVGRGSGVELDGETFSSWWLRHGRILRLEDHGSERGARRGLGLED